MVFNIQLIHIAEPSNIIQLPSRSDVRKPGWSAGKYASAALELIQVPAASIISTYKYPVRMFTIQPQE